MSGKFKFRILMLSLAVFSLFRIAGGSRAEAADGRNAIVLEEPVETEDKYSDNVFMLTWTPVPGISHYEAAIYAEGEDAYGRGPFAIRSEKNYYEAADSGLLYLLSGIYTDTVRYRVKVRPVAGYQTPDDERVGVWSNIWEIRYTDGSYTVTATDEDFDEEIEAQKEKENSEKPEQKETGQAEKKEPLPHHFPEPLLTYLAREYGEEEPLDASKAAELHVGVNYCEYGEPTQIFTDDKILSAFRDAVKGMTVTGKEDDIFSTETYYGYSAADAEGNGLFSFSIQAGLLEGRDGRYAVEGLGNLLTIDGIMLAEGWSEYWGGYNARKDDYERSLDISSASLLDAAGYGTHCLAEAGKEALRGASVYIDWNPNVKKFTTGDPEELGAIFDALSEMTFTNEVSSPKGQMWHITLYYLNDENLYDDSAWLEFKGKCVKIGDDFYEAEGLDRLFGAADSETLRYLSEYSEAPILKPSY